MKTVTTWSDTLALNWCVNVRSRISWFVSILAGVWVSAGIAQTLYQEGRSLPLTIALFFIMFLTAMAAIGLVSGVLVVVIASVNIFRKGSLGPKMFTMTDDVLMEDDGQRVTAVPWAKIRSIEKTRKHIFVRISRWKYLILSARDFQHEYQFAQYYADLLKARHDREIEAVTAA